MKIHYNILLLALFIPLFLGCEQQAVQIVPEEEREVKGVIVAMGDSLTAGLGVGSEETYPALLGKKLRASELHYKVINAGVSGETSSGALSRLSWVLKMKPDIIILETGANDGFRGLPVSLIRDNIRAIVEQLQERNIVIVLAGMKMVANLGDAYTQEFRKLYEDLAREYDVIFMPFFLDGVATRQELNQSDGIHPNSEGYRVVVEKITPHVLEAIARLEASTQSTPAE